MKEFQRHFPYFKNTSLKSTFRILSILKVFEKRFLTGWRGSWSHDSMFRSPGCSSRGQGFHFQLPHDGSQLSISPFPGAPTIFWPLEAQGMQEVHKRTCKLFSYFQTCVIIFTFHYLLAPFLSPTQSHPKFIPSFIFLTTTKVQSVLPICAWVCGHPEHGKPTSGHVLE